MRKLCTYLMAFVVISVATSPSSASESVFLENDHLRIEFSKSDGSVTRLLNRKKNLELITKPTAGRPWAMLLGPAVIVSDFTSFEIKPDEKASHERLSLRWRTPYDIEVSAEVTLPADSDSVRFESSAINSGEKTILALRYPDIQGIGPLSDDGESDRLLHSTVMGAVFKNPFRLFQHKGTTPQQRGMVVSRYPNGFHGSAMQLMAYYSQSGGGFYFAVEDGQATDKDLNFFKATEQSLSCEFAHLNWDARPGKSLTPDYPVVIAAMTEGNWYAAADRYREWAIQQKWCDRGTRFHRQAKGDAAKWLLEDIGAVGMWWPFRNDIRATVRRTREVFGKPLLHLELWWQHAESVAAAREDGDRFGPFYFPHLAQSGKATHAAHKEELIFPPAFSISPDWQVMCAAQEKWRRAFVETAEDMVGDGPLRHHQIWMDGNKTGCNADCLYFDIGPCAGVPTHCYAAGHDHNPGSGRQVTAAHVALICEAQRRASLRKGVYVPVGTECISEPFVGCFDLYYPRNAGLGLDMELLPYIRQLTWLPDGRMEVVPLFEYVYHEHGPLAVQGIYSSDAWTTPASENLNTWAEARSYLWGGLLVTGPLQPSTAVLPHRQRFLRSLAAARTDFAREYLAYGRMQRPPQFECAETKLEHGLGQGGWLRELRFDSPQKAAAAISLDLKQESAQSTSKEQSDSETGLSVERWVADMLRVGSATATTQTLRVPSIVCNAFTRDDRLGLVFVNLKQSKQTIRFPLDPSHYGLPSSDRFLSRCRTLDGEHTGPMIRSGKSITLRLPPREVLLLEVLANDD